MKTLTLCLSVLICSLILIPPAFSAQITPINVDSDGVAIKGYDPVAYFTLGRPVKGLKEFQHEWQGARWLLASREHLSLFQEDPEKYAPKYGGY